MLVTKPVVYNLKTECVTGPQHSAFKKMFFKILFRVTYIFRKKPIFVVMKEWHMPAKFGSITIHGSSGLKGVGALPDTN